MNKHGENILKKVNSLSLKLHSLLSGPGRNVKAYLDFVVGLKVGFSDDPVVGVDKDRSALIARISRKA